MKKRIVSILLAVVMIVGMIPLSVIPAFAEEAVTEYYALDVDKGAYIDTGFKPSSNTRVVMDAVVTMDASWANLFGVYREDSYFYVNSELGHFGAGFGSKVYWVAPFAFARRKIELDRNLFKLDGETEYTFPSADFQCSDVMYLFALNKYGEVQFQGGQHIRFYSCQIYNNGNMVFDFVPAGKGGKYGLYDKKSGAFYEFNDDSYVTAVNGPAGKTALPTTPGSTLTSGTYVVSQDTTIEAGNGQSALVVNGFVTIIIEKGVTLTVKGGNADGTTGAGAGIEVPDGCALTVAGGGKLIATGGNASKGANGEKGGDGLVWRKEDKDNPHYDEADWCQNGWGGKGGNGGGGAGAGIGGKGGAGGAGGDGGWAVTLEADSGAPQSGRSGTYGRTGTAGESCGNVSIYDSVTYEITGGSAYDTLSSGGQVGEYDWEEWTFYYIAFGGGGGGGGGNGYPAADIGSGGAGGGGGGGGGSGIIVRWDDDDDFYAAWGYGWGGYGGVGYGGNGGNGSHGTDPNNTDGFEPGAGGSGGAAGGDEGTGKSANILPTVKIPAPRTDLVYNGKEQEGVSFSKGSITGNKATNAGEYTATLTLPDGYYWQDGMYGEKTVDWSIANYKVSLPEPHTDLVYNGKEQEGVSFSKGSITDNKATNAGTYTATLTPSANYCWEDGSTGEKTVTWSIAKCPVSLPKASYCYTGDEIVIKETDLYTVENGKATEKGNYTATLTLKDAHNYTWENSDKESISVNYDIHEFSDDGSGKCKHCGGTVAYCYGEFPYLEKTVTDDNTVITEEKMRHAVDRIAAGDTVWGIEDETVWYLVDSDITLTGRPEVKGTVNMILQNGVTLTANNGITVEEGNTLNIYAQSDDESIMGKLTADTEGVTAIGGRDGVSGADNTGARGGNGTNAGTVYVHGGNISLKSSGAPCIGGGNGGDGGRGENGCLPGRVSAEPKEPTTGGNGGNGGNGAAVYFIGGNITMNNTNTCCLGGGNGGGGGQGGGGATNQKNADGGDGGNGGCSGFVYFIGGNAVLQSDNIACIGVGVGGNGGSSGNGIASGWGGSSGKSGDDGQLDEGYWNVSGSPVIKAGTSEQDAKNITVYDGQPYLSVHYHTWKWFDDTYHKCAECGEKEEHNANSSGVCPDCSENVVIPVEKAPTCIASGHIVYYKYKGKCYSDADCTNEITNIEIWLNTPQENGGGMLAPTNIHTWQPDGDTQHKCSVCDAVAEHVWVYGKTEHTCSVCGKTGDHVLDSNGDCSICGRSDNYIVRSWNDTDRKVEQSAHPIPSDATVITSGMTELKGGWYLLASDVKLDTRIKVTGTVNIILMDGFTLTAPSGIEVVSGNTLNIYGQKGDSGKIVATGEIDNAGIGGERYADGGNVTVYGGEVTATGGEYGAGIGGGMSGDGGNVTVYGGTVNATGTGIIGGAGIGGGQNGNGGDVKIYGGIVTAQGGDSSAGIGGDKGGNVYIYGGSVNAYGGNGGAGIGGGHGSDGVDVTIYGGTVTATGSNGGAGIGGGNGGGNGGTLTVYGGTVIATGSRGGAGIGGGDNSNGGNVYIYGGVVTATSGGMGAQAIGRGVLYALYRESGIWYFDASAVIKAGADKDNANYTEYNGQPYVNIHWHNFVNGECTVCGGKDCEHTNRTVTSHSWSEDHSSCTLYWHCDDCNEDFGTVSTEVNLVEDEKGTCQTKGKGHYEATFDGFDTVIKTESKFDTELGDHNFVNYVCTCAGCTAEKVEDAKNDAKKAIQNAVDNSEDTIVLMLAEAAEDAIDNAEKVAEVLKIRDLTVSQINAIKDINKAAGDNPIRKVKAVIDIAKEDISSATSVEEVIGIRNECFADIKKLTGEVHEHTFAENYSYNESVHWKECTCGHDVVSGFGAHEFKVETKDGVTTYTCACGYTKTVKSQGDTETYEIPDEPETPTPIFKFDSKNLALESVLAFRFKGYLDKDTVSANAYMEFKIGNGRTVNVPISEATVDEKGRYVFTCYLNVLEVDEKISAIFHDGENTVERQNPLSVTDYLDWVMEQHKDKDTDADKAAVRLVTAISNYVHYSQIALDYTHSDYTVGEGGTYQATANRSEVVRMTDEELALFKVVKTTENGFTSIKASSRSLILDDKTAIVMYLIPADVDYVPNVVITNNTTGQTVKDATVEKQSDGRYKIVIPNLAAHMLNDKFTVSIDGGKMTFTNLSALSYAYSVFANNDGSEKSKVHMDAVSAIYEYYKATVDYVAKVAN